MNRIYEELFILRPDVTEEEVGPIIDQISDGRYHRRWNSG